MTSALVILLPTVGACLVASFLPIGNTDLIVATAAAAAPPSLVVALVLLVAMADIAAKSVLFMGGSRIPARLPFKAGKSVSGLMLFASASSGLPPFFLTSISGRALNIRFKQFVIIGLLGRITRFSVVV
ncbi:MAG TPA: hypothetical protein VM100_10255, partial [Longimicrobiales bacterium]|nr:hypothetical protein [Longimicrobiales bacterium]